MARRGLAAPCRCTQRCLALDLVMVSTETRAYSMHTVVGGLPARHTCSPLIACTPLTTAHAFGRSRWTCRGWVCRYGCRDSRQYRRDQHNCHDLCHAARILSGPVRLPLVSAVVLAAARRRRRRLISAIWLVLLIRLWSLLRRRMTRISRLGRQLILPLTWRSVRRVLPMLRRRLRRWRGIATRWGLISIRSPYC